MSHDAPQTHRNGPQSAEQVAEVLREGRDAEKPSESQRCDSHWTVGIVAETVEGRVTLKMTLAQAEWLRDEMAELLEADQ